ncbi:hypothetical protein E2562_027310 [Oryza meyeriana var. granulata]|uniref:Uncharacterized protein n=1 Tax=Oryza meyeriana var. granulata TaxID=110450 RepID=A0A6G1C117_9ORYZ|nr:hypothetical protein E2562_027310 [Oryza meyeriana var. granulata]
MKGNPLPFHPSTVISPLLPSTLALARAPSPEEGYAYGKKMAPRLHHCQVSKMKSQRSGDLYS